MQEASETFSTYIEIMYTIIECNSLQLLSSFATVLYDFFFSRWNELLPVSQGERLEFTVLLAL